MERCPRRCSSSTAARHGFAHGVTHLTGTRSAAVAGSATGSDARPPTSPSPGSTSAMARTGRARRRARARATTSPRSS
eukprot:6657064-Alexandrium_andersonii.AAC.1